MDERQWLDSRNGQELLSYLTTITESIYGYAPETRVALSIRKQQLISAALHMLTEQGSYTDAMVLMCENIDNDILVCNSIPYMRELMHRLDNLVYGIGVADDREIIYSADVIRDIVVNPFRAICTHDIGDVLMITGGKITEPIKSVVIKRGNRNVVPRDKFLVLSTSPFIIMLTACGAIIGGQVPSNFETANDGVDYADMMNDGLMAIKEYYGISSIPATIRLNKKWLTHNNNTVLNLAYSIYHNYNFGYMPVLGDALEEAGCDDEFVLSHCYGDKRHYRGCWLIDNILGYK